MMYDDEFLPRRRRGVNLVPRNPHVWAAVAGGVIAAGTAVYSASQAKKNKPGMASAVDPQAAQYQAIQGNLSNQADIEKLVSSTNKFDQSQALSLMNQAMPGYSSLASKLTGLASNLASNPYSVPADVQANMQRLAAEKGISTGRQGQAGQFSLLRDLGVNELQYGQTQIGEAQGITGLLSSIAPKVNPMSPISMYLSPAQALGTAENNQAMQQGNLNAQAAAANANAQTTANMWGQIGGVLSGAAGKMFTPTASTPTNPINQQTIVNPYSPGTNLQNTLVTNPGADSYVNPSIDPLGNSSGKNGMYA